MGNVYGAQRPQRASARSTVDARVAAIAARQSGVFSRAQAARAGATNGMIRRRVEAGRWERLARDVFAIAGAPSSQRAALLAVCLAWGSGTVVSHLAATTTWQLEPFEHAEPEITIPRGRRRTGTPPAIVHERDLPRADVTTLDGIPITTPMRTLLDLAVIVPHEQVEEALDDALRRRLVTIVRFRRRLDDPDWRASPGRGRLRKLLEQRDPTAPFTDSILETRLLRAIRKAGLPPPRTQYRIRSGGHQIARVDFAYPEQRLVIETDGFRFHSGRVKWEQDRARLNALTLLGWRVIHVTAAELRRDEAGVIDRIRTALLVR